MDDAVDAGDAVARLDAGLGGGRAVDRRDHLDQAVFLRDFDADAAELALGGDLHVVIGLGVHVAGMRIEIGHHALDGGVDQLAVLHRAHIVGAHAFEGVGEQIELAVGARVSWRLAPAASTHKARPKARDPSPSQPMQSFSCSFCLPQIPGLARVGIQPMTVMPQFEVKPFTRRTAFALAWCRRVRPPALRSFGRTVTRPSPASTRS